MLVTNNLHGLFHVKGWRNLKQIYWALAAGAGILTAEQVKALANKLLAEALASHESNETFQIVPGGELGSVEGESFSFEYEILYWHLKFNE